MNKLYNYLIVRRDTKKEVIVLFVPSPTTLNKFLETQTEQSFLAEINVRELV